MTRKRSVIEAAFKKKGFRVTETHHRIYKFYDGDKYTGIHTFISTGSKHKEYSNKLLSSVKKQLKFSSMGDFLELIDCTMSEAMYREMLTKDGYL